jgi:hypothetical protein
MTRIAGYLFHRDDDRLLTYRKSWRSYAVGCVIAAVVFLAVLVVLSDWRHGHTFYVGAGRHTHGTPVAPADQTWSQFAQSTVCPCAVLLAFLLAPVAYVIGGSDEQRNPFIFDRQRDRVFYGSKELCNMSAIVAIRLVEAPGGRKMGRRTGIFARLNGPPWSIELGCFGRYSTAQHFAEEISGFLNVGLYDDPIIPRRSRGRGFDVITQPSDGPKRPADKS